MTLRRATRLATPEQVRALEALYRDRLGLPLMALMEAAGAAVARAVGAIGPAQVVAVCGQGNNGGDGLVAARRLLDAGLPVEVRLVGRVAELKGDALAAAKALRAQGGAIREQAATRALPDEGAVLIDGLLGSGLSRAPEGPVARAIRQVNAARDRGARVVAVDVPSGLSPETGEAPGACVSADVTVTFAPLKIGLALDGALERCGQLEVAEIGIPSGLMGSIEGPRLEAIDAETLARKLGPRPRAAFKNRFGHVLCAGGMPGRSGAIALSALGALRAGAGLVTVCSREPEVRAAQAFAPELMGRALPGSGPLGPGDLPALLHACEGKSAVVCGPGLDLGRETGELLRALVRELEVPLVLDADGLNALGSAPELGPRVVITPHPGEAARLLGTHPRAIQADRVAAAQVLQRETGAVVVLKGARTLVASGGAIQVNLEGSPLLATAGSGDVLAGILGALVARGQLELAEAAALAVALHSRLPSAYPERGSLIATDLAAAVPILLRGLGS